MHVVEEFYEDPAYIDSVVEAVNGALAGFADPADVDFVFSAHSVPVAVIEKGDPYQRQIERTTELVWQRGGWPGRRHLCYQSKVGASKWLAPSMHETDQAAGGRGPQECAGRADLVRLGSRGDAARDRHRASRAGAVAGNSELPDGPGTERFAAFIEALAALVRARTARAPVPARFRSP